MAAKGAHQRTKVQPARRGRGRRPPTQTSPIARIGAVGLIVVLVVALFGGALATRGDDDGSTPTTRSLVIDAAGQELLDLLDRGADATLHLTYSLVTPGSSSPATIDVYRAGGRIREELALPAAAGSERRLTIFDGASSASCAQPPGGLWTCAEVDPSVPRSDVVFGAIRPEDVRGREVTVADGDVEGRQARCFSFTGDVGATEACLDGDGVPLLLVAGGYRFTLTAQDDVVEAAMFLPPAPVT